MTNAILPQQVHMCSCGLLMHELGNSGHYTCTNCDTVQIGERNQHPTSLHYGNQGRVATERDARFEAAWTERLAHDFDKK